MKACRAATFDDKLTGTGGNDLLYGDDGKDTLIGGNGNDSIEGGDGEDTIDGGVGNDTINGGTFDDTIDGGAGNDTLFGGSAIDTLTGGLGGDRFAFSSASNDGDADFIMDFSSVQGDKIMITKADFGLGAGVAIGGSGANNFANHFVKGAGAVSTANESVRLRHGDPQSVFRQRWCWGWQNLDRELRQ